MPATVFSVCEHGVHTHERRCNECSSIVFVEGHGGTLIERTRPYPRPFALRRPGVWTI